MSITSPIKPISDNLVFHFDTKSPRSYLGAPTTNLLPGDYIGAGSNYNNVGGSVTTVLSPTADLYKGAPVWKQTLTPLDASGVSWLSNGNNPGIGVVTGGGGGLANRYTGHSIYFKPTVQMYTYPIYTHYSNIAGWQSSTNYEIQWDGWYRANVIWYDTVTRSDGKYWAINPLSAIVNVPIVIYWAAPFKEDSNRSNFVAPFATYGSPRSVTGSLMDMVGNYNIDLTSAAYDSAGDILYSGAQNLSAGDMGAQFQNFTVEIWFKSNDVANYRNPIDCNWLQYNGSYSNIGPRLEQNSSGTLGWAIGDISGNFQNINVVPSGLDGSKYHHAAITKDGTSVKSYYNGSVVTSTTATYTHPGYFKNVQIGRGFSTSSERWFSGYIPSVKIYNRALSGGEITINYNANKSRFGL